MKKKNLLVLGLATVTLLSYNNTSSAETTENMQIKESAIAYSSSSGYQEITSQFSSLMKRNSLLMAYAAYEAKQLNAPETAVTYFIEKVRTKGPWDYKWQYAGKYIYQGRNCTGEDLGNMHYGYVGRAGGFTPDLLKTAAGLYQIKSGTYKLEWISSYFDDPNDQAWINYGIQLWDNKSLSTSFTLTNSQPKFNQDVLYQEAVKKLSTSEKTTIKEEIKRIYEDSKGNK
ncbi:hypothetical protein J0818_28455 [Bacillus cereus]|uniref:Bacterial toxin 44 domain-containing protein n=1 Tax=Bacillus mobilis TaxID=2026190 RepID=A0A1Y5Z3T3_9BACI|nr:MULTISPECIES: polymorphic toxin type 44 domain-containing protein [Bacillus cereus group]MBL3741175.1 hypothetical protein [Bacillus cereus]MBL3863799.1 hypothetical protein [Bacillus cereus]SMD77783.1 hypothetical protein BACERE00185_00954 [Bacillus mobilis]